MFFCLAFLIYFLGTHSGTPYHHKENDAIDGARGLHRRRARSVRQLRAPHGLMVGLQSGTPPARATKRDWQVAPPTQHLIRWQADGKGQIYETVYHSGAFYMAGYQCVDRPFRSPTLATHSVLLPTACAPTQIGWVRLPQYDDNWLTRWQ